MKKRDWMNILEQVDDDAQVYACISMSDASEMIFDYQVGLDIDDDVIIILNSISGIKDFKKGVDNLN